MQPNVDATELAKQKHYVELLAEETHQPIALVEALYGDILADLKARSDIPDFVPVFAWRRTRASLVNR